MRARRGQVVGVVLVVGFAISLGVVALTTPHRPRPSVEGAPQAAVELVAAWERSRLATFVRSGTFERRRPATGAAITSDDVLAQRPPARLHRQLGGVELRDGDRQTTCTAPIGDQPPPPCQDGPAATRSYVDDVAAEVSALRSLVTGPAPLYSVDAAGAGCFDLRQERTDPRAPFGLEARFCFDADTGAPIDSRVRYPGGVVEVIAVIELRAEVTDADLRP